MKIYFAGSDGRIDKLLSLHGEVVSEKEWFDRSHILVVDNTEPHLARVIQEAQNLLKPVLILTNSGNLTQTKSLLNGYPFATVKKYRSHAELKTIVDAFFEKYGKVAKENNAYCCGGGCCQENC